MVSDAMTHSLRLSLNDELHARPFPKIKAPCRVAFIALKPEKDNLHSQTLAKEQLAAFLKAHGKELPDDLGVYLFIDLGGMTLKWESHSEFATYTLFTERMADEPFATDIMESFQPEWLEAFPGRVLTSIIINIDKEPTEMAMEHRIDTQFRGWFKRESFAASFVTEREAAIAGDFHLDPSGHIRFAILGRENIGPRRLGRVVQRLLEIETYKSMSMLTLPHARRILDNLAGLDDQLSETISAMSERRQSAGDSLETLLKISADLSVLSSRSSFRLSAGRAYEALVNQRMEILREERVLGRQLFSEFLMRRYDPIMRTCRSASQQLEDLSNRAAKASELLGTRVSVTTANQNRELLAQMDRRAAQQARLQETVEGISVVAISYYAVSLLTYLLAPLTKMIPISKTMLASLLVIPVALIVWTSMHRLKEKLIRKAEQPKGDHKS